MESIHVFIIILLIAIVLFYMPKIYETYVSGSFDISPSITTDMDWNGSQVASQPYYPNNLTNAPQSIALQIKKLQSYQADLDGPTTSSYVSNDVEPSEPDTNNVNELEGFTMMNPYISQ